MLRFWPRQRRPRLDEWLVISCACCALPPEARLPASGRVRHLRMPGAMVPAHAQAPQPLRLALGEALATPGVARIAIVGRVGCGTVASAIAGPGPADAGRDPWRDGLTRLWVLLTEHYPGLGGPALAEAAAQESVLVSIEQLLGHPAIARAEAGGALTVHGWVLDGDDVYAYDFIEQQFCPTHGLSPSPTIPKEAP